MFSSSIRQAYSGHLACLSAALFSFYDLLLFSLFNIIAKDLKDSFHLNNVQLGSFSSSYLIANAIGLIIIGILLDKYSLRKISCFFLSLCSFACFILATTHSLHIAVAMRFIQGLASANSLLITTRMPILWFPKKAAWMTGLMMAIALSGGIVGNTAFNSIIQNFGWRYTFYLISLMGIMIFFLVLFFLRDNNKKPTLILNLTDLLRRFKYTLFNYPIILFGVYLGLMSLPIFIWGTLWGNLFLTHSYFLTNQHAAIVNSLLFFGIIVGSPILGYFADYVFERRSVLIMGTLFTFLLIGIIMLKYHLAWNSLAFLFFTLGFFLSSQNIAFAIISEFTPNFLLSTSIGIASFFTNIIGALAQIGFGYFI